MKLLGIYKNGNYKVTLFDDGTKIRRTEEDEFIGDYPECIDYKITNHCDMGCPMCHENSVPANEHGNIMNQKFIDTLMPYTELAIGGGNPLSHPDLEAFLQKLKDRKIIANMTVNQVHFEKKYDYIKSLLDKSLIKGLGISLNNPSKEFIEKVKTIPNAVIHVINGMVSMEDLKKLYDNDLKILILGYKIFGKGVRYYNVVKKLEIESKKKKLKDNLKEVIEHMKVVSFDNLAIEQLDVKSLLSEEDWNEFYMGDDGKFTMYIDGVKEQFAMCSVAEKRYDLKEDIRDMFKIIKGE